LEVPVVVGRAGAVEEPVVTPGAVLFVAVLEWSLIFQNNRPRTTATASPARMPIVPRLERGSIAGSIRIDSGFIGLRVIGSNSEAI